MLKKCKIFSFFHWFLYYYGWIGSCYIILSINWFLSQGKKKNKGSSLLWLHIPKKCFKIPHKRRVFDLLKSYNYVDIIAVPGLINPGSRVQDEYSLLHKLYNATSYYRSLLLGHTVVFYLKNNLQARMI